MASCTFKLWEARGMVETFKVKHKRVYEDTSLLFNFYIEKRYYPQMAIEGVMKLEKMITLAENTCKDVISLDSSDVENLLFENDYEKDLPDLEDGKDQ